MLIHKGTIKLETDRLILRQFKRSDAEDMFKNWASDEEVAKYMRWEAYKSIAAVEYFIEELLSSYEDLRIYRWAVELKSKNQVIGQDKLIKINIIPVAS
jgi:ribosomal-protein-alanine N-acetyltransferase